MRILPAATLPWREHIQRRHAPRPVSGKKGYRKFLPCLRWEFGFSCAFCLCHEADFTRNGAQRLGIMQVEHFLLQSQSPAQRNRFSNCFLICRLCNMARSVAANQAAEGQTLLNPCLRAWREAFELTGDEILPRHANDADASYTRDTYDLNGPHKVRMRKLRRETIGRALAFLEKSAHLEQQLLDRALAMGDPVLLDAAETVRNDRKNARRELQQFLAVPHDADPACHCGNRSHHRLPEALAEQTVDISPFTTFTNA